MSNLQSKEGLYDAFILAGGKGTRFRPFTEIIHKSIIPIGKEERPVIFYILNYLSKFNILNYIIALGYKYKQIMNYLDCFSDRFNIKYSLDDAVHNGTGGALLKAYKLGYFKNNNLLIWYGDILAKVDIADLFNRHVESNADVTLVLANNYQIPVGYAKIDPHCDCIVQFIEKPHLNITVTIGILIIKTNILSNIEKKLGTSFDIMSDMIPHLLKEGKKIIPYIYRGKWFDLGSFERYIKMKDEIDSLLSEL